MSKSCSCGGSNENCCWCFGTGIISHKPLPTKAERGRATQRAFERAKRSKIKVRCDRCSFMGTLAQVAEHERNMHKAYDARVTEGRKQKKRAEAGELPPGGKVVCPYCRALIDKPNYYYHLSFMHPNGSKPTGSTHLEAGQMVKNAVAKARVSTKEASVKASSEKTAPEKPDTWKERLQKAFTDVREQKLDATTNYAHNFREHGKFGSHPVHDDFGDDSEP